MRRASTSTPTSSLHLHSPINNQNGNSTKVLRKSRLRRRYKKSSSATMRHSLSSLSASATHCHTITRNSIFLFLSFTAAATLVLYVYFIAATNENNTASWRHSGLASHLRHSNKHTTTTTQLPNHFRGKQFPPPLIQQLLQQRTHNQQQQRDVTTTLSNKAIHMCTKTLWHTLETTTIVLPNHETFIHTGDIDDLWLRDSAAQIHPVLLPYLFTNNSTTTTTLLQNDAKLDRIVAGLIQRTAHYIRHDPYANAFRIDDSYVFSPQQKLLGRHDLISTWNYELDSACYYIRMLYFYWNQAPDISVVQQTSVQEAVEIMVDLWKAEQQHELDQYPDGTLLDCLNCRKPYRYRGLPRDGKGTPTNATAGLTWTGFRPSDDACQYGYLIPANMFAVVALEYVVELAQVVWKKQGLAKKAQSLAKEIRRGIEEHGIVKHDKFGMIYAYEVDGLGNANLMDDANIPNLMSIPYLGYKYYDPDVYANTRRFIMSTDNPTYHSGTNTWTGPVEGYGSPHMAARIRSNIWPMSIAMQALTAPDVNEKIRLAEILVKASAGTGWMHESFDVHNPAKFTRSWFCWSDSLFAELVMSVIATIGAPVDSDLACPSPDYKYKVMEWRDPIHVRGGLYAAEE